MRGPVVDIPIVLVEEQVVLLELVKGHCSEVVVGEGGAEEIGF